MKKVLAALMMVLSFGAMAQVKIGFVDTQRLLDTMPSRKVAIQQYQEYEKSLRDELQTMAADFQKMYEDFERKAGDMTPVLRQHAEKKLMDKQRLMEERQQSMQEELQAYGEELNKPILAKVQKAIGIIAERQKLSMVVDVTSTLYYAPEMNITNVVGVELMKLEK